jgi:hypothetical protein
MGKAPVIVLLGKIGCVAQNVYGVWLLNCQAHDMPILVGARLLKPLANPPPNSVKYFAASELLEQVEDQAWLAKVTNTLTQHLAGAQRCQEDATAGANEDRRSKMRGEL